MTVVREYLSEEANLSPKLNNDEPPRGGPGHLHFTGERKGLSLRRELDRARVHSE